MLKGTKVVRWQPTDIDFLKANYQVLTDEELARALNRTPEAVQTKRNEIKLIKDKGFSIERSKKTQFKKGHVSVIVPHHLKKKRADAWTDEQVAFLKENWEQMTSKEVAAAIGRTRSATTSKALELGIKKSDEAAKALRRRLIGQIQRKDGWTPEQLEYLKSHWESQSAQEIAYKIGRTAASVKTRANDLGLKTSKETLIRLCKRPNAGQFTNGIAIGDTTIRTNAKGVRTVWIKTGPKQWLQLSRYNWLQAGREIPEDVAFYFIDGDSTNCALENLELRPLGRRASRSTGETRQAARLAEKESRKAAREAKRMDKQLAKEQKVRYRLTVAARRIEEQKLAVEQRRAARLADREQKREEIRLLKEQERAERLLSKQLADKQAANKQRVKAEKVIAEKPRSNTAAMKAFEKERKRLAVQQAKAAEKLKQKLLKLEQQRRDRAERERKRLANERENKAVLPTTAVDLSERIPLRIDAKTVVYIRPDQDPDAVKQKYLKTKMPDKYENLPPVYQF